MRAYIFSTAACAIFSLRITLHCCLSYRAAAAAVSQPPVYPKELTDTHVRRSSRLKAGESTMGKLLSPKGMSAIYALKANASIVFETLVAAEPASPAATTTTKTTTLVTGNPKKVAKVLQLRAEILAEQEKEMAGGVDGADKKKGRRLGAAVMRLVPFGKAGWLRRRARDHAVRHLGEVAMSITKRGILVRESSETLPCFYSITTLALFPAQGLRPTGFNPPFDSHVSHKYHPLPSVSSLRFVVVGLLHGPRQQQYILFRLHD